MNPLESVIELYNFYIAEQLIPDKLMYMKYLFLEIFAASKKVALVSQADLNNMKVDKERKQNQVTETNENDGLSAEDRRRKILGLDPLPEAPPRYGPTTIIVSYSSLF